VINIRESQTLYTIEKIGMANTQEIEKMEILLSYNIEKLA
jgi:hypothetical protein